MAYFMAVFGAVIFLLLGSAGGYKGDALTNAIFTTISFLLGAITSIVSGYLGMMIATYANARTTLEARKGVGAAFLVAFRSGAVMGFSLTGLGLLVLFVTIVIFQTYFGDDWGGLFEAIA